MNKCIPCLGSALKDVLKELKDYGIDTALENVPDCPEPREIQLCIKPPRAKSQYQVFISDCMKSKPIKGKPFGEAAKYMKECSVEWKQVKNNGGKL